jgi:hypothetical protein
VSELSPAAQSLETSEFCRSDAVTTQPPPGPPAPSSGRCANASKVEPAERHAERHKPNPARTVRSFSLSQRDDATRLVRFCCAKRWARSPPCSAGADCGDSFPGQELMRSPLGGEGICQCAKPIFTAAGHRPVSPARSLEPLSAVDVAVPPDDDTGGPSASTTVCRPRVVAGPCLPPCPGC